MARTKDRFSTGSSDEHNGDSRYDRNETDLDGLSQLKNIESENPYTKNLKPNYQLSANNKRILLYIILIPAMVLLGKAYADYKWNYIANHPNYYRGCGKWMVIGLILRLFMYLRKR